MILLVVCGRTPCCFFFFNDTATTEIYTLSLHDALPIYPMTILGSPSGAVGTAVFPGTLLDAAGRVPYYTSAMMASGDEYFTELASAADRTGARSSAPPRPGP